ncbi:MAG: trigger factor, partial [Gammaproteobacteria bacterium]|nr:trigger factor [Gammaproteobacteria bacterium]
IDSMKGKVKLAGFRPGKVPLAIMKKQFGSSVRQEVIADLMQETYIETIKNENLTPAGHPTIDAEDSEFGKPLSYNATVEVLPEIKLNNLDKQKIEKFSTTITDTDFEEMLQKFQKQHAEWKEVERGVQQKDQLLVDFEGKIKNEVFKGGSGKDFKFELGAGTMLEDFEKPLIGAKAGETKEFKLKFPKDYSDAGVAGKKADFSVTVHKIFEAELPKLDDADFLQKVGIKEGGEPALRDELRKNMQRQLEQAINSKFKEALIGKMLELNPIDLPKVLIENEITRLQQQMKQQFAQYTGGSTDGLPDLPGEEFAKSATRNVKLGLLSNKLIDDEKIIVDPAQVRAKIEELAATYDDPEAFISWYSKNDAQLAEIESIILEEELMKRLENQANVVEKKTTFQEVIKPKQQE